MSDFGKAGFSPTAPGAGAPQPSYPTQPGIVGPRGTHGGQTNAAYAPVNDEKRSPMERVNEAATAVVVGASAAVAAVEHAAFSPPAGGPPPSYSQTVQPGGYPQPQPGYQQYPPQQGYPLGPQAYPPQTAGYGATAPIAQPQPTHTTSVLVMGSSSTRQYPEKTNDWDKGLCSCFSNCGLCLLSYFCPCYVVGKYAEALGHSCVIWGVGSIIPIIRCIAHVMLRSEIRDRRGIKGSEFGDFCYVCFCSCCALIQEANEVRVMEDQDIQRQ